MWKMNWGNQSLRSEAADISPYIRIFCLSAAMVLAMKCQRFTCIYCNCNVCYNWTDGYCSGCGLGVFAHGKSTRRLPGNLILAMPLSNNLQMGPKTLASNQTIVWRETLQGEPNDFWLFLISERLINLSALQTAANLGLFSGRLIIIMTRQELRDTKKKEKENVWH